MVGASKGVDTRETSSYESSLTSSKVRSGRGGARFGVGGASGSWSAQSRPTTSSTQQRQEVPSFCCGGAAIVSYRCIAIVLMIIDALGSVTLAFAAPYTGSLSASVNIAS